MKQQIVTSALAVAVALGPSLGSASPIGHGGGGHGSGMHGSAMLSSRSSAPSRRSVTTGPAVPRPVNPGPHPLPSHPLPYLGFYGGLGAGLGYGLGYYGYDPYWYGASAYAYDGDGYYPYATVPPITGGLRLEVTPKTAQVFVDGYYAGIVDDFNGRFHHLNLVPGPHHLEVRLAGYQSIQFDVNIQGDHTTDYHGRLVPQ